MKQNITHLAMVVSLTTIAVIQSALENYEASLGFLGIAALTIICICLLDVCKKQEELLRSCLEDLRKANDSNRRLLQLMDDASIYTGDDKK